MPDRDAGLTPGTADVSGSGVAPDRPEWTATDVRPHVCRGLRLARLMSGGPRSGEDAE